MHTIRLRIYLDMGTLQAPDSENHHCGDTMNPIGEAHAIWDEYGQLITTVALGLALVALAATIVLRRKRKDHDIISVLVTLMALALTAEGMYWVLTTKLSAPLPWWFAIFVCSVLEGLMINFFRLAKTFQARHQRPGPFATAFWVVAAFEGALVAMAATNAVEIFLRLLLPSGVALLHWLKLTAETSDERKGQLVWTPLNLLIRIGAWKPGEQTLDEADIKRREDKLVKAAYLMKEAHMLKGLRARRVRRLTLRSTPEMAESAVRRVRLAYGIEADIMAIATAGQSAVQLASEEPTITSPSVEGTIVRQEPTITSPSVEGTIVRQNGNKERPRSTAQRDADIVTKYWEALSNLSDSNTLCRSSIERTCAAGGDKVLARQANRVLSLFLYARGIDPSREVEERVCEAIERRSQG